MTDLNQNQIDHYFKLKTEIKNYNCNFMIVSKNRTQEEIIPYIKLGHKIFGENRVIEANEKFTRINNNFELNKIELHLIGLLQSNKVKLALQTFDVIQTIDRKKLIDVISKEKLNNLSLKTKSFFIQVNIGNEPQKTGIRYENTLELYEYALISNIKIDGLMCIPPNDNYTEKYFQKMNLLRERIGTNLLLSMGMSNDYELALKHGTNLVRLGSKIFN